jgi:hypothetical protein
VQGCGSGHVRSNAAGRLSGVEENNSNSVNLWSADQVAAQAAIRWVRIAYWTNSAPLLALSSSIMRYL